MGLEHIRNTAGWEWECDNQFWLEGVHPVGVGYQVWLDWGGRVGNLRPNVRIVLGNPWIFFISVIREGRGGFLTFFDVFDVHLHF